MSGRLTWPTAANHPPDERARCRARILNRALAVDRTGRRLPPLGKQRGGRVTRTTSLNRTGNCKRCDMTAAGWMNFDL